MTKQTLTILLVLLFALTTQQASGQKPIELGVKGGLTIQKTKLDKTIIGEYNLNTDNNVGYQLGMTARINLPKFHIQPELIWNINYFTLDARKGVTNPISADVSISSVDVPVMFGKRVLPYLRLQAGPVFNLMSESKFTNNSNSIFTNIRTNKPSISYALGAGIDIKSLNFDVRYYGEFKHSKQNLSVGSEFSDFKNKLDYWSFSVGYFF